MTVSRAFLVAGIVLGVIAAIVLFGWVGGVSLATAFGLLCLAVACLCAAPLV